MTDFRIHIIEDAESVDWKVYARGERKVEAIKAFRGRYGAGLKEAKDVVEEYTMRLSRGEVFNGRNHAVNVRTVSLPNGGTISVANNGLHTAIVYSRTEAYNLRDADVPQAIADAVLKYSNPNQGPFA